MFFLVGILSVALKRVAFGLADVQSDALRLRACT